MSLFMNLTNVKLAIYLYIYPLCRIGGAILCKVYREQVNTISGSGESHVLLNSLSFSHFYHTKIFSSLGLS